MTLRNRNETAKYSQIYWKYSISNYVRSRQQAAGLRRDSGRSIEAVMLAALLLESVAGYSDLSEIPSGDNSESSVELVAILRKSVVLVAAY